MKGKNKHICPLCSNNKSSLEEYCEKCSKKKSNEFNNCFWGGLILGGISTVIANWIFPNEVILYEAFICFSVMFIIGLKVCFYKKKDY